MPTRPSDVFESLGKRNAVSIFKPKVVALVVSQSEDKGPNLMTASWWMLAGYNPYRLLLTVSHKAYTHEIIEENQEFVLASPTIDMVDALTLAGKVSGRDLDKIEHLGLDTVPGADVDVPLLADAVGNVECTVMDAFEFEGCTYYFANVENVFVQPGNLDGRVLSPESDVLAYMGSDWDEGDTATKYRHYANIDADDMERFRSDDVFETLPEHLREDILD